MAEGYMSNDSALYVTGSCAFSSSLYVSWGAATGSATTVGIRQNDIGTLEFKDNATGSWTEFGNSRDLTSVRNAHLVLIDDDVAHGITNVAQTDAYGDFGPIHSTRGGLMINGMSDQESAAARSLALRGISNDTHTDTVATVEIIGAKRSGTTVQALASAETVLEVANHTTALVTVLGDGAVGIGVVDPDSPLEILDTSTQQKWSYDSDSFATIAVAASSNTTIATGESGNLTLDSAGDITLDADGADVYFKDAGVQQGVLKMDTANKFILSSSVSVNDVYVMSGRDIVLDASAADISLQDDATQYLKFTNSSGDCIVYNGAADKDIIFKDLGGNTIVTIDGGDEAIIVADDKKLYFGDNKESSIEYDENDTNKLIISGSATGINISGAVYLRSEDKLYFGTVAAAASPYIMYGNPGAGDEFVITLGSAGGGIQMPDNDGAAFEIREAGNTYMRFNTGDTYADIRCPKPFGVMDDVTLNFGTPTAAGVPGTMEYDANGTSQVVLSPPEAGFSIGSGLHRIAIDLSITGSHGGDNTVVNQLYGVKIPNDAFITRVVAITKTLSNLNAAIFNIQLSATSGTAEDTAIVSGTEILGAGASGTVDSNGENAADIIMSNAGNSGIVNRVWMNTSGSAGFVHKATADNFVYVCNAGTANGTTAPSVGTMTIIIEYYGID